MLGMVEIVPLLTKPHRLQCICCPPSSPACTLPCCHLSHCLNNIPIRPATMPTTLPRPLQTAQQSLEVAQDACNDLDLRAATADAAAAGAQAELQEERQRLEAELAEVCWCAGVVVGAGAGGCVAGLRGW